MPREGQAKVLTKNELNRLIKIVSTGNHAKRNIALLYVSFGLGLRVKEIASLNIHHVMNKNKIFYDEIILTSNMTKGENKRSIYLTHPKVRTTLKIYLQEREQEENTTLNQLLLVITLKGPFRHHPNGTTRSSP